jgi:pyruvate dehydrogenase E2 component (dihydrolipoamide acetyltransferase)
VVDVTMPRLSDSMEEGTVLKWLVEVGGDVRRGQPLVEIETDKANMTYEADTDGVVVEVVAQEGDTLAIGEVIARIGEPGEGPTGKPDAKEAPASAAPAEVAPDEVAAPEAAAAIREREPASRGPTSQERAPSGNGDSGRVKASPVARRVARELGVELAALEGSGPGGRIVKADVEAAARSRDGAPAAPAPEPARGEPGAKGQVEVHELTRLQQTVSRRMAESKATAPDFSLSLTVDMTLAVELRERLKQVSDPAPSYNDMVVKAVATALRDHARVNGAYRDGKWELYERVNVGVAVAAEEALVVPTVFDADRKSLGQIARDARALAEKVRDGSITPPELSGATFTVSNLGMFGIEQFTAIINSPQAAILTVGKLAKQPAVDDTGRIVARDQMQLSLVCDHRILYGADGARFLARVNELLEQAFALAL